MKKIICVVTGSRADYGLLRSLLERVKKDKELTLQLIVTGAHLVREFGLTYREIEKDGFGINDKINILSDSDEALDITNSMAKAMSGFAAAYKRMRPDIVVVLGDRFEIFSAVTAAHVARIPVAHIHGGELTRGAIDDAFRHSITKMSHLHFTATPEYRYRVIQLGEDPQRVFCTGALGIDNIRSLKPLSKAELEVWTGLTFNKRNLLITFHPVTLEDNTSKEQFRNILMVLDELKDTSMFFTKANADMHGRVINNMIDKYVASNRHKANAFASMGQLRYLSVMKYVDAVVGNSSSGIIEAPSFRTGTIDIGDRQAGRIKASSVIDCLPEKNSIRSAFKKLYSLQFQRILRSVDNPYGDGNAAKRIVKVLKEARLNNGVLKKHFYNIKNNYLQRKLCKKQR